jgi:glycosyltransferase involved in cell wall biosynthesis
LRVKRLIPIRILLLSFYYPPDIGPGSLRAKSLVDALLKQSEGEVQVDVLTTMPNRYHSLALQASAFEKMGSATIKRFALPEHQNSMLNQAKAFLAYVRAVRKVTRGQQWDIVVATSSRLMTATLSAWVAKRCHARLYLDIRDLFTDTLDDVLEKSPLRLLLPVFRSLERWTFCSADRMNVVSAGFLSHIRQVVPELSLNVFTNGIDDEFFDTDFTSLDPSAQPLVIYAGNIGDGQGLHHVIPNAAEALEGQVRFRILGDGSRLKMFESLLEEKSVNNVQILKPVPRHELFTHYREANVLFLHLNDHKAFCKVLPSKIFEYAATGKPILAGVSGYAAEFLREQVPGVEVFEPCDTLAMQAALRRLLDGPHTINRKEFCARYGRQNIMRELAKEVLSLGTVSS